ncbi:hypothetical protein HK096_004088, partial [Nowakowskiella sp. JEL0078]
MSIQRIRKIMVIPREELYNLGVMHEKIFNMQKFDPTNSKPYPVVININSISAAKVGTLYLLAIKTFIQLPVSIALGFPMKLAFELPISQAGKDWCRLNNACTFCCIIGQI